MKSIAFSKVIQKWILLCSILILTTTESSEAQEVQVIVKSNGAKLTESESISSKELAKLEQGDKLDLLEVVFPNGASSARFKVKYHGKEGYVSAYFIEDDALLNNEVIDTQELVQKERDSIRHRRDSVEKQEKILAQKELEEYWERIKIDEEEEIRKNDSIADLMWRNAKAQNRITEEQRLKSNRVAAENRLKLRRSKFHEKYGIEVGEKIASQKIWIGMTEEMLLDSWGKPHDINKTVTQFTNKSQYVYGNGQYVYVENGSVTAWQN